MEKKGILFDYNGVLVADEHLQHKAMAQVLAEYGVPLDDKLYSEVCLGRSDRAAFQQLKDVFNRLEDAGVDQLINKKVRAYQVLIMNESILYPGIPDLLANLSQSFLLGIVSGALKVEIEPVLTSNNIAHYFQCLITADSIRRSKPNPDGYLLGVESLGLSKDAVIAIEDTPAGVRAAKMAGIRCIAVEHTVSRDQLAEATLVIPKVTDITPELIQNL